MIMKIKRKTIKKTIPRINRTGEDSSCYNGEAYYHLYPEQDTTERGSKINIRNIIPQIRVKAVRLSHTLFLSEELA